MFVHEAAARWWTLKDGLAHDLRSVCRENKTQWPRKGYPEKCHTKSCREAAEKNEFRGSLARKCAAFVAAKMVTPFPPPLSGPVINAS